MNQNEQFLKNSNNSKLHAAAKLCKIAENYSNPNFADSINQQSTNRNQIRRSSILVNREAFIKFNKLQTAALPPSLPLSDLTNNKPMFY
jgi:hypothetical protein